MIVEIVLIFVCLAIWWVHKERTLRKGMPPGPWGIPILGNMLQLGDMPHKGICEIGKKYGKIFSLKLGEFPVVVINDSGLIRKSMKMEGFEGRPNFLPIMDACPHGLVYSTGKEWEEQRRFALHKLRDYGLGKTYIEDKILFEAQNLVQYFKDLNGKYIEPRDILQTAMLNTIWSMVVNQRFSLDDEKIQKFMDIANKGTIDPPVGGACYFLPWLTNLFPKQTGFSDVTEFTTKFIQMCTDIINEAKTTYSPDVERHFTDSYRKKVEETTDPNSSFFGEVGETNFSHSLVNLFIAGSDTLTATISWAILILGSNPGKLKKLQDEIDSVVGTNTPSSTDRANMPYTEATLAEIMRFSSILPNSVLHASTKHVQFEGYTIPPKVVIMPNLYGIHRDPALWGDPETFRPERFLNKEGKYVKSEHFMPFCVGKRACLGENLANAEAFLYLTTLVQAFDFKFDPSKPKPTMEEQLGLIMHPKPFNVAFIPRS